MPVKKYTSRKKITARKSTKYAPKYRVRAPARKTKRRSYPRVPTVNPCDAKYALAIVDPFHPLADGACIPKMPARSSFKTSGRLFGTFSTTAAEGTAYIVAKPCLAKDLDQVVHSTSSATTDKFLSENATIAVGKAIALPVDELPLTYSAMVTSAEYASPFAKGRIVSAGLRIRYIGKSDEMNGVIYAYSSPAHNSIEHMDVNALRRQGTCRRIPVSRAWTTVTASGVTDQELNYSRDRNPFYQAVDGGGTDLIDRDNIIRNVCYPLSDGGRVGPLDGTDETLNDQKGSPIMGFWVVCQSNDAGNPSNAAPAVFEYEYIVHVEYAYREEHQLETPNMLSNNVEAIANARSQSRVNTSKSATDKEEASAFVQNLSVVPETKGTAWVIAKEVGIDLFKKVMKKVSTRTANVVGSYIYEEHVEPFLRQHYVFGID